MKLTVGTLALLTASKAWGNDWSPYLEQRSGPARWDYERKHHSHSDSKDDGKTGPHSDSKDDGKTGPPDDAKDEKCPPHCCDEHKHPGGRTLFERFAQELYGYERKGPDDEKETCTGRFAHCTPDTCGPGTPGSPECKHCDDEKKHCPDFCKNTPIQSTTTAPPLSTVTTAPPATTAATTTVPDTTTAAPATTAATTEGVDTGTIDPNVELVERGLMLRLARALDEAERDARKLPDWSYCNGDYECQSGKCRRDYEEWECHPARGIDEPGARSYDDREALQSHYMDHGYGRSGYDMGNGNYNLGGYTGHRGARGGGGGYSSPEAGKQCASRMAGSYTKAVEAKKACSDDKGCGGVERQSSGSRKYYYLCDGSGTSSNSRALYVQKL